MQTRQAEASLSNTPCRTNSGTGPSVNGTGKANWWEGGEIVTVMAGCVARALVGMPRRIEGQMRWLEL